MKSIKFLLLTTIMALTLGVASNAHAVASTWSDIYGTYTGTLNGTTYTITITDDLDDLDIGSSAATIYIITSDDFSQGGYQITQKSDWTQVTIDYGDKQTFNASFEFSSDYSSFNLFNLDAYWEGDNGTLNDKINSGYVTFSRAVPIPGAALLFGTGIVGLLGLRRKFH